MQKQKKVQLYTSYLKKAISKDFYPRYGIVLGTGLGSLADNIDEAIHIPYQKIQNFPISTVESHCGKFITGYFANIPVIIQQGRCHLYEGKTPDEVCAGIRTMGELGISGVILTNAAGAINPLFNSGELMIIEDHINMTGESPLIGSNIEEWGPRFPDMQEIYCRKSNTILEKMALSEGIQLRKGIYLGLKGPQLETRAETRCYRTLGADAVGMSTVLEAIAATHMGIKVTGISCLSNKNLPDAPAKTNIEEILCTLNKSEKILSSLLTVSLPLLTEL